MSPTSGKEGDEEDNDNVPLFLINKSGFPITPATWDRMFNFSMKLNEEMKADIEKLQSTEEADDHPLPSPPVTFPPGMTAYQKIDAVQNYMRALQYNHTGTQFYDIRKNRPLCGLNELAREMIRESLPIKCLEAVILGIHLTNNIGGLERFTIGMRSEFEGNVHRHVVLGLCFGGVFGSIGMSRRDDLMYKPMTFRSLSDLIFEFKACYEKYWHSLKRAKIGLPISSNPHSFEGIPWKGVTVNFCKEKPEDIRYNIDKFSKKIKTYSLPTTASHNLPSIKRDVSKPINKETVVRASRNKQPYQIRI